MQSYVTLQKRIMRRLKEAGYEGMSRSDLYKSLSRPLTKRSLDIALNALRQRGMASARRVETGRRGRPSEVWWARGSVPKE
jgi:hypothetical protein